MKRWLIAAALALSLAACNDTSVHQPGEKVAPPVKQTQAQPSTGGPGLCMPCFGPHISLSTGSLKIGPSFSPGISLF